MNDREFKRHCRNRNFYVAQVYCIEEEIKNINIQMSAPRGPQLEVIGAPAHNHESHIVSYISRKMALENEKQKLLQKIEMVDRIKNLPRPWNDIFWKNLVEGEKARKLCEEYYISKDAFYRRLKRYFSEVNNNV